MLQMETPAFLGDQATRDLPPVNMNLDFSREGGDWLMHNTVFVADHGSREPFQG